MRASVAEVVAVEATYAVPSHLQGACRQDWHRIVMAGFEDGILRREDPRSDAGCLFRMRGRELLVRHRVGLTHQVAGLNAVRSVVEPSLPERRYTLQAEVNAEKAVSQRGSLPAEVRARHNPRGRRIAVPQEELTTWATQLLARAGIDAAGVKVSDRYNVRRAAGRAGMLPAVGIAAEVSGGPALDRLMQHGLGRAKAYGFGLCVIGCL